MIKNIQNTDEFDNFFKKKYAKDTIKPSRELWENIEKKMKFNSISTNKQNILKLKIAVATLAVALIGVIIFFGIALQNSNTQKTETINFNENTHASNKEVLNPQSLKNKNTLIVSSDAINDNMQETKSNKYIKNTQKDNYPKNKILVDYKDSILDNPFIVENKKPEIKNMDYIPAHHINDVLEKDTLVNSQFIFPDSSIENHEKINNNEISVNETQNSEVKNDDTPNEKNKRKEEGNRFSVELSITPQYSYRTLYNNTNYYDPDLGKAYFNSREKPNISLSAGFLLIYRLDERWNINIGAAYSQYSQKMKISSFDLKTDNQNHYYIYTSIGINDLTINSSEPVSNVDFLKSHILYSFINIPLTAEYKLTDKFFITGGINYSFLIAKNINWQSEDYKGDFSITTNNITGLKTSNFSFMLGAGYVKSIGQNFSLIINSHYTSFMTSITNEMPVNTYPYSFGLKLGLRYKF